MERKRKPFPPGTGEGETWGQSERQTENSDRDIPSSRKDDRGRESDKGKERDRNRSSDSMSPAKRSPYTNGRQKNEIMN